MNITGEIVQLPNDMQKQFDEFGEITFETKQRLNEILKDKKIQMNLDNITKIQKGVRNKNEF